MGTEPRDIDLTSHGVRLGAWHLRADHDRWATGAGRPCVVMAHGFGCTKDSGLLPFAERFAAAGADVVLFDYRGFGTSDSDDGTDATRQRVDHRRHREDYVAVLDQVRDLPDVDPDRVVLWGSSYSGGHVVAVAAADRRVAGVISQGAAMDGARAVAQILSYAGPAQLAKLSGVALRAAAMRAAGRPEPEIPIVAEPGTLAAITASDALPGYSAIAGPTFENRMKASGILPISMNRPVSAAASLTMPVMLVIAEQDSIAPVAAVEAVAEKAAGPVTVHREAVGHFDIYLGEPFERSVAAQVDFLRGVVGTEGR
ncbi:alpha/beta fold hydrolase [Nocardioidaceae bacterium]|nr:alpha/beta fold hydrolase [Nocardioidaceae bacterium]